MSQVSMADTVCMGTSRDYHVNDAFVHSTYVWKIDGALQNTFTNAIHIKWNTPGVFQISVQEFSADGCAGDVRLGTVYVNDSPSPNAGPDASMCYKSSQRLHGTGGSVYHWSPDAYLSNANISNPVFNPPGAGKFTFYLEVSDASGCTSGKRDSVVITVFPDARIFAGKDTIVTINTPLQLHATDITNSGFNNFVWSPPAGLNDPYTGNPVATLNTDITYTVTARTSNGCEAHDDISIKVFAKADLFVPSAFTPNGDGLNDVLKVIPAGIKELKYFNIYNRWGELVFSTKDYTKGWDGLFAGKKQGTFTFIWTAEGVDFQGNVIQKKGTVTLIR